MLTSPPWIKQKRISLQVQTQKLIFRNKTSSPFLSGDLFASLCDYSFDENFPQANKDLSLANSIFCQSDRAEEFLEKYWDQIRAKILVLGNSDRDFCNFELALPISVNKVFLQNSYISDGFFHTLPIGIENLRYGRNGLPNLFSKTYFSESKSNRILVGPFSPTHFERQELMEWGNLNNSRIVFVNEYLLPKQLAKLSSTFRFVACPRGNGTDTHRFWETLYRGSIPVVKRSNWTKSIRLLGLPILELENWSFEEFQEKSGDFDNFAFDPTECEILWADHWKLLLNSKSE
jgi:hypothetical protein